MNRPEQAEPAQSGSEEPPSTGSSRGGARRVSLGLRVLTLVGAVNLAVFGAGLAYLSQQLAAVRQAEQEETARRLVRSLQKAFSPDGQLRVAPILEWPLWAAVTDAVIADRNPSGVSLNPVGAWRRDESFDLAAVQSSIDLAVRTGETVSVERKGHALGLLQPKNLEGTDRYNERGTKVIVLGPNDRPAQIRGRFDRPETLVDGMRVRKCATESDVVNVVAGCLGVRAGLAPSGHSTEDEFRIALVTHIGADTESLHHARPKTFNQCVGSFDEVEKNRNTFRVFEVEGDALSTPQQHITHRSRRSGFHRLCSIDTNHFGSHIRQHHCGEGAWPNSGNFKDSISAEWS